LGDNADMAMIELVDFNELYNGGKKEVKAKSRRGGKAKADEATGSVKKRILLRLLSNYENNHSIRINYL
jgi:hypothetical protein